MMALTSEVAVLKEGDTSQSLEQGVSVSRMSKTSRSTKMCSVQS